MPGGYLSLLPLLAVALAADAAEQVNPAPTLPLLREMAGTWSGKEWMWLGHHTNPIGLPDAIAYRRLIDGKLLEERMVARPQSAYPFTRISFFPSQRDERPLRVLLESREMLQDGHGATQPFTRSRGKRLALHGFAQTCRQCSHANRNAGFDDESNPESPMIRGPSG